MHAMDTATDALDPLSLAERHARAGDWQSLMQAQASLEALLAQWRTVGAAQVGLDIVAAEDPERALADRLALINRLNGLSDCLLGRMAELLTVEPAKAEARTLALRRTYSLNSHV